MDLLGWGKPFRGTTPTEDRVPSGSALAREVRGTPSPRQKNTRRVPVAEATISHDSDSYFIPEFTSTYKDSDYAWSDDVLATIFWDKSGVMTSRGIELNAGYYRLSCSAFADGNCHLTVELDSPSRGMENRFTTTVFSAPYVTVHTAVTRISVNSNGTMLSAYVRHCGKGTKDISGAVTLAISQRGARVPVHASVDRVGHVQYVETVSRVREVSRLTSKNLGYTAPFWTTSQSQGWDRDLTEEGVEPNPGPPNKYIQYLIDRGEANPDILNALIAYSVSGDLSSNPFGVLTVLETVSVPERPLIRDPTDTSALTPPASRIARQSGKRVANDDDTVPSGKKQKDEPRKEVAPELRIAIVAQRIAKRIMASEPVAFAAWLYRCKPSAKLTKLVAAHVFGSRWADLPIMTSWQFMVYCYCNRVSSLEIFDTFMDSILPDSSFAVRESLFLSLSSGVPYIANAARMHNKKMHILNGNIFSETFRQIMDSPSWQSVLSANPGVMSSSTHIGDYETLFTAYARNAGPNVTSMGNLDGIINQVIGIDNTVMTANVRFPASPLMPRNYLAMNELPVPAADDPAPRGAAAMPSRITVTYDLAAGSTAGVAISDTFLGGLEYSSFGLCEYRNNMLTDTIKATEIKQSIQNTASARFRANDIDTAGFMSLDVANICKETIAKGFNIEVMVMRLMLLIEVLALPRNRNVPASVFSNIDGLLRYDPVTSRIHYNHASSQITGAHNFPFIGGHGTLRFHITMETVIPSRRATAVFLPPFLLNNAQNPQISLAIFIISLCEWPFGLYSYTNSATYPGGVFTGNWLHRACMTRVPGPIDLDIIIPRRTSEVRPRSEVDAKSLAQIQPQLFDGTSLRMIYIPDDQVENVLSVYLNSYARHITHMMVFDYLSTLNLNYDIARTVATCSDIISASVYTFPSLVDDTNFPDVAGDISWSEFRNTTQYDFHRTINSWMGYLPRTESATAPFFTARRPVCQLYEFSFQAWNKVVLGLAASEDTAPSRDTCLTDCLSSPKLVFWNVLRAMILATTSQTIFSVLGLTSDAWDGCSTNQNSIAMQRMTYQVFCQQTVPAVLSPPPLSGIFSAVHAHLFSLPLATITYRFAQIEAPITVFSRQVLPDQFAKALGCSVDNEIIRHGLYTPSVIIDVFLNILSEKSIRFNCNLLPSYVATGTYGYSAGMVPKQFPRTSEFGPYMDARVVDGIAPVNKLFVLSDEHLWNNRIFMTSGVLKVVDHTNTSISEKFGDICPRQRKQFWPTADFWAYDFTPICTSRLETAGCATTNFPSITKHALLPIPVVGVDRRMMLSMAMHQQHSLARETWRIAGCCVPSFTGATSDGDDFWSHLESDFRVSAPVVPDLHPRTQNQAVAMPNNELAAPAENPVAPVELVNLLPP